MPNLFDVAWTANRWVGKSPELYAVLKRLYDRFHGAPDLALRRILEDSEGAGTPDWPEPTAGPRPVPTGKSCCGLFASSGIFRHPHPERYVRS